MRWISQQRRAFRTWRPGQQMLAPCVACLLAGGVTFAHPSTGSPSLRAGGRPPAWTADAIWYQVFVARFANGDPSNDPPGTLAWTNDWTHRRPDEHKSLAVHLHFRRYGGDLQGLREKLPYLLDLGVNALYLNPVFQADSEHKYDTVDYRHIDDSFGVAASRLALTDESLDPSSWAWSESDRVFLDFLDEAHRRGLRIMIDGVFNHVGASFWAWQDVLQHGRRSPYADWFEVTDWGPPLKWNAWDGPNGHLVRFRRFGDGLHRDVERHLFAIVRRWMDPNGDGDPSDGVDGWRLDAAEQLPHGFWRRFRRVVKGLNTDAFILGEIWIDPQPWLAGDQFDAVTNYPFANAVTRFLREARPHEPVADFAERLMYLAAREPQPTTLAMLNLLDSHDTERAVTQLRDPVQLANPPMAELQSLDTLRPDTEAYQRLMLAALLQFTAPGAPIIYYGDEAGMYGGDDPFCRAPMWWSPPTADNHAAQLRAGYRALCRLRSSTPALRRGACRLVLADNARQLLAFSRILGNRETIVLVNADAEFHDAVIDVGKDTQIMQTHRAPQLAHPPADLATPDGLPVGADGRVTVACPPRAGILIDLVRRADTERTQPRQGP